MDEPLAVYGLSYQWYSFGGFILVIVVGLISSAIRGFQDPKTLDPELVFNTGDTLFWYLPKNAREFLRFNVGDNHVMTTETASFRFLSNDLRVSRCSIGITLSVLNVNGTWMKSFKESRKEF